jgi:glutaminase
MALVVLLAAQLPSPARGPIGSRDADFQLAISQAHKRYQPDRSGTVADAMPPLAKRSPDLYGLALVRVDGKVWEAGDSRVPFALSAVAAPFTAALAAEQGTPAADDALGMNGALVAVSLVKPPHDADAKWRAILGNLGAFAGRELFLDQAVYASASSAADPVLGSARELAGTGRLADDAAATADLFVKQGAVALHPYDLAVMAATLANDGRNPVDGQVVVKAEAAKNLQALIARSGLQKLGAPAVAGKSGCIIAVVPRRFGLATCSPPLDTAGNSVRGQRAIKYLSKALLVDQAAPQ